jgi:hypothetical protein
MLNSADQYATIKANETELEARKAEIQSLHEKVSYVKSISSNTWLMYYRRMAFSDSCSRHLRILRTFKINLTKRERGLILKKQLF